MIEKNISDIETKIRDTQTINADRKEELLHLLARLKAEVGSLAATHEQKALDITDRARVSTQAVTLDKNDPKLREQSLKSLRASVEGFEQSHPQLVQVVNGISNTLSSLGI